MQQVEDLKILLDEDKKPTEDNGFIVTDINILTKISEPVNYFDIQKSGIKSVMEKVINSGWVKGLGLSAIQIDIPIRYAIYKLKSESNFLELINPVITFKADMRGHRDEGCLSLPKQRYQTWRYYYIEYECIINNEIIKKKATGIEALVIQHEVDHMDGILCSNRIIKPKTPGRNDPCACGSGRKFKKCCDNFTVDDV